MMDLWIKKLTISVLLIAGISLAGHAQLADSCKLVFGTNLTGLSDWGTELSLVDMMKNCRTWFTKDAGNPNGSPWDTGAADSLSYRADGYPTHIPQSIPGRTYSQQVATVWAGTDGWQAGQYVVLFDGTGTLSFWGGFSNLVQTSANRYTFDFDNPVGNILELIIETSDLSDPVHNVRVLKSDYENTYLTEPFDPVFIGKIKMFKSVRFMGYGSTNNWGCNDDWTSWGMTAPAGWDERVQPGYYTYATNKGAPYELMIKLMNDYDLDGWVCVPHIANNDYIGQMAQMFHEQLEPERRLTVEYSNEIWNWMFGQTIWCYHNGCELQNKTWPEGIVSFIQNCMDIWTNVYGADSARIKRVVGLQTAWLDVSQRIANNMRPGSFDAVAPTFYFRFTDELEAELDTLGAHATAADVAVRTRLSFPVEQTWLQNIKTQVAEPLNLPMAFYEGGQHLTPNPFGEEPTYAQALLDIQRDTAMYHLYNEWFSFIRTLQQGPEPLTLMNFALAGPRSARYGSWGILETMNQDTAMIPAPKYRAIAENIHQGCFSVTKVDYKERSAGFRVQPNPACRYLVVENPDHEPVESISIIETTGKIVFQQNNPSTPLQIDLSLFPSSLYLLKIKTRSDKTVTYKIMK
ncbi:MAG: T9SS type A sorting domain-containing protein [Bacteroidales bacterium]